MNCTIAVGESFVAFLASFECFCESLEAPDAAKKHVFLSSLPVDMKFEMQADAAKKHVFLSSLPVDMKFEMQEADKHLQ